MYQFQTKEELIKADLNPYNVSGYIVAYGAPFQYNGAIYTPEEVIEDFETFAKDYPQMYYVIHWEGEPIETDGGDLIAPAYDNE